VELVLVDKGVRDSLFGFCLFWFFVTHPETVFFFAWGGFPFFPLLTGFYRFGSTERLCG